MANLYVPEEHDDAPLMFMDNDGSTLIFTPFNGKRSVIVEFQHQSSSVGFKTRMLLSEESFGRLNEWMIRRYSDRIRREKEMEELDGFLEESDDGSGV